MKYFLSVVIGLIVTLSVFFALIEFWPLKGLITANPIYVACLSGVLKLKDHPNLIDRIKILLEQGANINAQTNEGDTAVILAGWETDNLELVRFLVEQGANVNIPNENGDTPVIDAADLGKIEILKFLLENGADVNIKNKAGRSASNMAANSEVMKVLADYDK